MYRLLSMMILAFAFLMLAGCGSETSSESQTAAPVASTPSADQPAPAPGGGEARTIGVSIPSATHGWPAGVIWWAERSRAQYPDVKWEFQTANAATDQVSQVEAMLEKGIDALVILPFDSSTPMRAVQEAKRRGVYIVSVDRGLDQPIADLYIAGDNRAFGRRSAEYMAEKLGGKGNIVILRGIPTQIDTERYEGAMEVFGKHPEIKVLGAQPGNWNRQDAYRVMQNFLTQHSQIDAVWASDDDMALGVEQAVREAGRQNDLWILGGAGMKDVVKRVQDKDPLYPADITYPPGMIAAGVHAAVAKMKNSAEPLKNIPEHLGVDTAKLQQAIDAPAGQQQSVILDVQLVTPENASQYYFAESVY